MASQHDTIVAMDQWLSDKKSPMAGFSDCGVWCARVYGISISLTLGIAQAETQCATDPKMSPLDLAGHNAWGYGHAPEKSHGWLFPSWPDSISSVTDWLAQRYVYQGLTTVEEICPVWVGTYSQSWIDNVSAVMRQFGGDPEKLARPRLLRAGEGTPPA